MRATARFFKANRRRPSAEEHAIEVSRIEATRASEARKSDVGKRSPGPRKISGMAFDAGVRKSKGELPPNWEGAPSLESRSKSNSRSSCSSRPTTKGSSGKVESV